MEYGSLGYYVYVDESISQKNLRKLFCTAYYLILQVFLIKFFIWFFFQVNSIFDMKKPYDLVGFLEQEKRVEQLESLKELLADTSSLDSVAERHEPDLEDRFYNNDLVNLNF